MRSEKEIREELTDSELVMKRAQTQLKIKGSPFSYGWISALKWVLEEE